MWKIKVWQLEGFSREFKYQFGIRRKGKNLQRYKGKKLLRCIRTLGVGRVC